MTDAGLPLTPTLGAAMSAHDDELWEQVGSLLGARPGWSLQASSSPGGPPAWCRVFEGEIELSVNVDAGDISVYRMDVDQEIRLHDLGQLSTWLDAHETASLQGPPEAGQILDELVHGKFTKWGDPDT